MLAASEQFDYLLCPHSAVGLEALRRDIAKNPPQEDEACVALATAHYGKFIASIQDAFKTHLFANLPQEKRENFEKKLKDHFPASLAALDKNQEQLVKNRTHLEAATATVKEYLVSVKKRGSPVAAAVAPA